MIVQPYLCYEGKCEEALEFYKKAIGAEVEMLMYFKDSPDPHACQAGLEDKVMHASFRVGESVLMASDGMCKDEMNFNGISLTISAPDEAKAEELFNALADGGQVQMPLGVTFFSPKFGMTADRFGVSWMVIVMPQQ